MLNEMPILNLSPQAVILSTDAEVPETPDEQAEPLKKKEPEEALLSSSRISTSEIAGNEHPTRGEYVLLVLCNAN